MHLTKETKTGASLMRVGSHQRGFYRYNGQIRRERERKIEKRGKEEEREKDIDI